ncbi:hypothetical protein GOP47_0001570 [Adiantum capillus-veneris]|uniref:LOB domain-containing protein n=1 Tax=Adiantum capillus-veneris TaxID=13818 RepID=A0A9D4V938_ADICA|nr:hypothetical protein GOP47_0001570 [Adiantum capillus-veneris]
MQANRGGGVQVRIEGKSVTSMNAEKGKADAKAIVEAAAEQGQQQQRQSPCRPCHITGIEDNMAMTSATPATSSSSPCAACKFLRRKCTAECVFAPYFPPDQPHKFANVHKVFGASNITKLLNELPPHKREDAVNSLAYEADARVKDPVYGCVGAISILQRQVAQLQQELAIAQSDLARLAGAGRTGMQQQLSMVHTGGGLASAMGMGIAPATTTFIQQHGAVSMAAPGVREHHQQLMMQHGQLLGARDAALEQLLEQLQRNTLLSREQLVEQLTRAGGGSLETGLAAVAGGLSYNASGPHMRTASDGGSGSSGGGNNMGHLSPS